MPVDAGVGDVVKRWRELSDEEAAVASVLVQDALRKLRIARPALTALVAAADLAASLPGASAASIALARDWAETIQAMVAEAVIRVLGNPDLYRSATIGADGTISVGYAAPSEVARARLALDYSDLDRMIRNQTGSGTVVSIGLISAATEAQTAPSTLPTP